MSELPIYGQAQAAQAASGRLPDETPPPVNAGKVSDNQVEEVLAARLAQIEAKYADRVAALEEQLAAANAARPIHLVPQHAGGPDYELASTWSQHYQELSRAGLLTDEHLALAGIKAG